MIYIDDKIQAYPDADIAQWIDELPQWRREKVLAFQHDLGRRQSLLAYRLLCHGLKTEYGITEMPTFNYGTHGKPELTFHQTAYRKLASDHHLHFSLSHCREAVACIITPYPIGIDIESIRRISESLIRHTMNDDEQRAIASASSHPERAFLRFWTQKEAVGKLLGTGIRDNMKDMLSCNDYHIKTHESDCWIISTAQYPKDNDGDPKAATIYIR